MKHSLIATSLIVALAGAANAQFASQDVQKQQPSKQPSITRGVGAQSGGFFGNNDECTSPDPISGQGTFSYDNTGATTGIEGQLEPLCLLLVPCVELINEVLGLLEPSFR